MKIYLIIPAFLFSIACSSVSKLDTDKNPLPVDHPIVVPDQVDKPQDAVKERIQITTLRKSEIDYIHGYRGSKSVLLYLEKTTAAMGKWLELVAAVCEEIKAHEVRCFKESNQMIAPEPANLKKLISEKKPLWLMRIDKIDGDTINYSIIDPVYMQPFEKGSFNISEVPIIPENELITLQKTGTQIMPIMPGRATVHRFSFIENSLFDSLKKSYSGKLTVLASAAGVKVTLKTESPDKSLQIPEIEIESLPEIKKVIAAGNYQIEIERAGFKLLTSRFSLRPGKEVTVRLFYPDDPRPEHVGYFTAPEGLLLYQNNEFIGYSPRVWDEKNSQPKQLEAIEMKKEDNEKSFFMVRKANISFQTDHLLVWQNHTSGGELLLKTGGYFKKSGSLTAERFPVTIDEKNYTGLKLKGKGNTWVMSPEIEPGYFRFVARLPQVGSKVRLGLKSGDKSFYLLLNAPNFARVMAPGSEEREWVKFDQEEPVEIAVQWSNEDSEYAFYINGSKIGENKAENAGPWQVFMNIEHENTAETKVDTVTWLSEKPRWLGIF